jgi:hypothetical protein
MFNTTFYTWEDTHPDSVRIERMVRAKEYSLPDEIVHHVESVFNTVQAPPLISKSFLRPDDKQVYSCDMLVFAISHLLAAVSN